RWWWRRWCFVVVGKLGRRRDGRRRWWWCRRRTRRFARCRRWTQQPNGQSRLGWLERREWWTGLGWFGFVRRQRLRRRWRCRWRLGCGRLERRLADVVLGGCLWWHGWCGRQSGRRQRRNSVV